MFEDIVRFGADALMGSSSVDDWISAAVDAAAATFGTMAPSLSPVITWLAEQTKDPAKDAVHTLADMIRDWAFADNEDYISGLQKTQRLALPFRNTQAVRGLRAIQSSQKHTPAFKPKLGPDLTFGHRVHHETDPNTGVDVKPGKQAHNVATPTNPDLH